jgi:preprotein translocase subunit SecG
LSALVGVSVRLSAGRPSCYNRLVEGGGENVLSSYLAYVNVAQIVISLLLMIVILTQAKGAGFNGTFSADSSIFRTRRGVEKTLFQVTIALCVIFVLVSIFSVVAAGQA